jgi:hypothetical protein
MIRKDFFMALYFKDRIPDPIHGENSRYYDAVGDNGALKLSDFKLVLKNNIPVDKTGDPVSADNLNFASGNITLPVGFPGIINKGDLLTVTHDGAVIPAKTKRNTAATGPDYSTAIPYGFLRLSNTKLLIIYSNRMVIATVNFNNKTVSFGTYFTIPANVAKTLTLVRSYDENPTALLCGMEITEYNVYPIVYRITNDVISQEAVIAANSSAGNTYISNPVRVNSTSAMVFVTSNNINTVYVIDCTVSPPPAISQMITGISPASSAYARMLYTYNNTEGKCLLIYNSSSGVFSLPINVNGSNITNDPPQSIGSILFDASICSYGGMDRYIIYGDKIILPGNTGTTAYGPARMQILSVNVSGTITKGPVINLPVHDFVAGSTNFIYKNDKIYITGVDYEVSPKDPCLLELAVSGTTIQSVKKYRPFLSIKSVSSLAYSQIKCAAYENPVNPGEFLFMASNIVSSLEMNPTFWFGFSSDFFNPSHVIGIALDSAANGYVKLQTSGKYLPGLYNGLQLGQLYMAGDNGSLVPYTGAGKPIGIATGDKDFMFFGTLIL